MTYVEYTGNVCLPNNFCNVSSSVSVKACEIEKVSREQINDNINKYEGGLKIFRLNKDTIHFFRKMFFVF